MIKVTRKIKVQEVYSISPEAAQLLLICNFQAMMDEFIDHLKPAIEGLNVGDIENDTMVISVRWEKKNAKEESK